MNTKNNRHARRGLTILFSLFPGGGHYYMGLMRRGAFYSLVFLLGILLSNLFLLYLLSSWFCVIVLAISIFDAYHCWRLMQDDTVELVDSFPSEDWFNTTYKNMDEEEKSTFRKRALGRAGIVFLVLGGLSLLSVISNGIFSTNTGLARFLNSIFSLLSYLLLPAALIVAGILLIRKNKD